MITLVTGYSRTAQINLPRLFNQELPWNYAVYSKNKTLKVRNVEHVRIEKTVLKDIEERFRYRQKIDLNFQKSLEYTNKYIAKQREIDPDYFIRKCFERVICGNEMKDLMITDFKYLNEMEFLEKKGKYLRTIRVISHNDEMESAENFSDIVNLTTDFLLVPLGDHELMFEKTFKKFPQYRSFSLNKNTHFYV